MTQVVQLSATIIALNEGRKIERCLKSLHGVADEIIVVDSFSTDATESICRRHGVRFIQNPFPGYVAQKNFAMKQATFDYVLSLDADEALSEELRESILRVKQDWAYDGYRFNRFNNYCGRWIRHSGWYPDRKIRLWDRRSGEWGGTDPHDSVIMKEGKQVRLLKGDILHYAYLTVDEHLRQMHEFGEIAARAKYAKGQRSFFVIHVLLSPLFKFVKKYFFQLGFLDGYYGFVFCAAASSFNFFKYLRLYEYNRKGLPEVQLTKQLTNFNEP
jgi:glycosyltransferase involved in cell wall biosynthesis